ncbi:glycerophosphodiester phosphodiesterase family protein [Flagellimonas sp. HMM57]|uniref:glycerophosphodiester phosphodiesterase family protein n=1 Tax=unclassified Flagellimonas TaxID=2644544 RepID=UPI0013D81AEB|nr:MULTISPECIES: glycerophosphodiester phosphodiesterase family protein [unclassified Flagellimonas]UII77205.1 glycerophosphodiester phosphodiesterase family protein [Flagellimonas sp. HMM57]
MKNQKRIYLVGILLLGFSLQAQLDSSLSEKRAATILEHLKNPKEHYVLAVSHRGDWRYAPENSLPAIQRCIDLGVDIVEIDVRLTKDGHLVAMHDTTVDRTTNGKGKVSDLTLNEIKTLRLKNACGVRGSKIQVPTLGEIMNLTKDRIMVNLDKVEGETVKEAYEILKKTGTIEQAIFKGRETVQVMKKKYGSLMDSIIYMPILIDNTQNPSQFVQDYNEILSPIAYEVTFDSESSENFEQIAFLKKENIFVLNIALWDALVAGHTDELSLLEGPDTSWGWLIENGANGIMTDRPSELLEYLKAKGLRNVRQ